MSDNAYADMSLNFTYGFDSEIFHKGNNDHEDIKKKTRKRKNLAVKISPDTFTGESETALKNEERRFQKTQQAKSGLDYDMDYSFMYDKFEVHENLTVSDVLTTNGWHINDDSVLFLSFRKKKLDIEKRLKVQMGPYGNCFTFNHPYHQETAGSGNGMKIGLNIMQDYGLVF